MNELYHMIFKRKSFRRFNDKLSLSEEELKDIDKKTKCLLPLINGIEVKYKIVPREKTIRKANEKKQVIYGKVI